MDSKFKYLMKNAGILTVSNFASRILVFLLVPLYTSVLSTEDVGMYDIVVSTASLLYPLLTLNICDAIMRFLMDKKYSHNEIAVVGIKYVSIGILLTITLLIIIRVAGIFQQIEGLEILITLYFVFYILNQFMIQFSKGLEQVSSLGIGGVIGTVVMIVTNILCLLVIKLGLKGFFVANILAQAIPALFLAFRCKITNYLKPLEISKDTQKVMLFFSVPLITNAIGWWVNSAVDRYTVTWLCGLSANGLISVSYKIPQIINTIQGIFTQAWQISAIKEYEQKDISRFYGQAFVFMNVIMGISCAVLIVLTKPLASLLYKNDFYAAWEYVPFLLISSVFNGAAGFFGSILMAKKDSKSMALSAVVGSVANIILNILLVLLIGIQGATVATAVSSFFIFVVRYLAARRIVEITDKWKILSSWVFIVVLAIMEILSVNIIIEIAITLIVVILYYKEILKCCFIMLSTIKKRLKY